MALGAAAGQVRRMVVSQGARVLLLGIVLGAAAAYGATRALGGLLFGVEAFDPMTYLVVSLLMVLVGLLASWVPARRASRVDPMEALRAE
jgi:ABC-type antimicrobial peptide transport system permease subunit